MRCSRSTTLALITALIVLHVRPARSQDGDSYNFEDCDTDADCQGTRRCQRFAIINTKPFFSSERCKGQAGCVCTGFVKGLKCSEGRATCLDGDRCRRLVNTNLELCVSCARDSDVLLGYAVEDVKGGDETCGGVCIAASALTDVLPRERLVFAAHARRVVLCDAAGSCATPGHMVVFHGEPMMMKTYCARTQPAGACTRVATAVNSPRMQLGLRLQARTRGLQYTAFAARYGSGMEERVLQTLLHAGM